MFRWGFLIAWLRVLLRKRIESAPAHNRLTDAIADQAHDRYGVDCLLDETDQPCEYELPGYFCCGVPGILAHLENGCLALDSKVQRCDLCQRYPSDEVALEKLRELGLGLKPSTLRYRMKKLGIQRPPRRPR